MPAIPALMIQGLSSNAGKTFLAAILCRIFADAGYRVAPFKAQNMTSRAAVLPDGSLMSGAQALQAFAARRAPQARMNPVLLRPCSEKGSEVIVLGRSRGVMEAGAYMAYKKELFKTVQESYAALARDADLMILEGAGSPAEINLRANDIVNMGLASWAKAHVLLAGDIDRGGVFAHFVGTMALLEPADRKLVKGFVINRFRGDERLLEEATGCVAARTKIPFLGIMPNIAHNLPQEDSLAAANHGSWGMAMEDGRLDEELSRLARVARKRLDMERIVSILGL